MSILFLLLFSYEFTNTIFREDQTVQKLVAQMVGWKSIVQSSLPCLLLLFWGSWSDRHHRRKPCMIVPIIGECMKIIGLLLCYYFVKWPMEYVGIVESLCLAITGIHHKV